MSLMDRLSRLARSPQGRRYVDKAKHYAQSPEGKRQIEQARTRLARGKRPKR